MRDYWAVQKEHGIHGYAKFAQRDQKILNTFFRDVFELVDKGEPILEVGCSVGQNLEYFRQCGYSKLCGVDISSAAIENCSKYFPDLQASSKIVCDDAANFLSKRPDNEFSLIFTVGTLQNIDDRRIFALLSRVSSKYILVKEPDVVHTDDSEDSSPTGHVGIFAPWNYEHEFESVGAHLLMKKLLPGNVFGNIIEPGSKKCPVLRLYRV